jgi:hypothetical protein
MQIYVKIFFPGITEDDVKPPIGIVGPETRSQVAEAWGLD